MSLPTPSNAFPLPPSGEAALVRAIGVRQLTAAIVNTTVGAGIFVLPALVAQGMGAAAPLAFLVCAAIMLTLAWLIWLKADRIWEYRDATDVLRIVYGPFVYFMSVMIGLSGLMHLYQAFERR